MLKDRIKVVVANHSVLLSKIYNLCRLNKSKIQGRDNVINGDGAFMNKCTTKIVGKNNIIILNEGGGTSYNRYFDCIFNIVGSNNVIEIGTNSTLLNVTFTMFGDNNEIRIGSGFNCHESTELAALEGTRINIGKNSLFSSNIHLRTGDSHSVLDATTGRRTNKSKDIIIGEHVWIGNSVFVLKGANIGNHSIVAIGSVVPGKIYPANSVIGGNPAKVIKSNVDWLHKQI